MNQSAYNAGYTVGVLIGFLVLLGIMLIPAIFYLLTLQKALRRCSPENREMEPGMVWLMFIPLFNLVWHFIIVLRMAGSLEKEFRKRGIAEESQPGKTLGMTMCILACCGIIPLLGILTSLGALVCWIMYWVKVAEYSRLIASSPAQAPVGV